MNFVSPFRSRCIFFKQNIYSIWTSFLFLLSLVAHSGSEGRKDMKLKVKTPHQARIFNHFLQCIAISPLFLWIGMSARSKSFFNLLSDSVLFHRLFPILFSSSCLEVLLRFYLRGQAGLLSFLLISIQGDIKEKEERAGTWEICCEEQKSSKNA